MDLIQAIIDHHTNGVGTEETALRAVLPSGKLVADFDWSDKSIPYAVVYELAFEVFSQGMANSYRIDQLTVRFEVFSNSRSGVATILEALENVYLRLEDMDVEDRGVMGRPQMDDRLISQDSEHWKGILTLVYMLQKTPQ